MHFISLPLLQILFSFWNCNHFHAGEVLSNIRSKGKNKLLEGFVVMTSQKDLLASNMASGKEMTLKYHLSYSMHFPLHMSSGPFAGCTVLHIKTNFNSQFNRHGFITMYMYLCLLDNTFFHALLYVYYNFLFSI